VTHRVAFVGEGALNWWGRLTWTREIWLWTGDVDMRNVDLDRGCGHVKCGSGQGSLGASNVALDRGRGHE
jgi:hypothetical protein